MRHQHHDSFFPYIVTGVYLAISAFALSIAAPVLAQPADRPVQSSSDSAKAADKMWFEVQAKTRPKSPRFSTGTVTQRNAGAASQAAGMRQGAAAAREFYTAFPNHPKAAEARKLEVLTTLYGVKLGEDAAEREATAIGKAFVDDTAHSAAGRFEVALAMGRLAISRKIKDRVVFDGVAVWEALADDLRAKFGDLPSVHEHFLDLACSYDSAAAERIAKRILEWPASAKAKTQAAGIVARTQLIGQKTELKLTTDSGTLLDFSQAGEAATVIVVWSSLESGTDIKSLKQHEQTALKGVRLAYVAMAATSEQAGVFKSTAVVPGIHLRLATPADYLALARVAGPLRTPYALALKADGTLSGFGRLSDIPNMLKDLSQ